MFRYLAGKYLCAMYRLIRSVFFQFDPEAVHGFAMNQLRWLCKLAPTKSLLKYCFKPAPLPVQALGLSFRNPVGLAAGFDKDARYLNELEVLGFGFVEIGTVTPKPQPGNDRPRLFRLPADQALLNRMGFNNAGADVAAEHLKHWRLLDAQHPSGMLIGGNIGKNKITPNEEAWKDYVYCFRALHPYVDYFVVNVSSPNTPGLRALQEKESLRKILVSLQELPEQQSAQKRPLLLKIAPDLNQHELEDVIDLALEIQLDGLVIANTTISRNNLKTDPVQVERMGAGGLSGKPLEARSRELLDFIAQRAQGKIPVIASGAIFTAADAHDRLRRGAQLVQVWTGFVYQGPSIVRQICKGLSTLR